MDEISRKQVVVREPRAADRTPELGSWWWHAAEGGRERWLGCVTHVGSNFAKLEGVHRYHDILMWEWHDHCEFEPDHEAALARGEQAAADTVAQLLQQIRDETQRLGMGEQADAASETQAMTVHTGTHVQDYKNALVKAQSETLPELFKKVEENSRVMADWMKARLMPMRAQADVLKASMGRIKQRIFNVELYAGLTEQVVQVREGAPAEAGERLRLFQRRAYMDEECLANYRKGGMEFKDLGEFDAWMSERENFELMLPFPRCLLAMRVRRHQKERDMSLRQWISFVLGGGLDADKLTFLYIRNGDQLWRLGTAIEFGEELFPDMDRNDLTGDVYADMTWSNDVKLVPKRVLLGMRKEHASELREWRRNQKLPKGHKDRHWFRPRDETRSYVKWSPDNVHFDRISAAVNAKMMEHNRLVLVLQGLFDRSPVLHPHPPVRLWDAADFERAVELLYDSARALVCGPPPDFEAYRAKLNETLAAGCVTVGQEDYWLRREADKYNAMRNRSYRYSRDFTPVQRHHPDGNPGPGELAVAHRVRGQRVSFRWWRERQRELRWPRHGQRGDIAAVLKVPKSALLNVDAYRPGDFRQFFADPRTRADYIKWAPLLLEAEEYHAGNRHIRTRGEE